MLQAQLRDGLRELVTEGALMGAETLADAKALYLEHKPQVVLLDVGLPDGNGLELLVWQHDQNWQASVLVLTGFCDEETIVKAIQLGAKGYLLKQDSNADIAGALLATIAGAPPLSPAVAQCMMRHIREAGTASSKQETDALPPRQQQTLNLLARGMTYQEIADHMTIKLTTVATHAQEIYNKLAVRSRSEAVFRAREMGIIE